MNNAYGWKPTSKLATMELPQFSKIDVFEQNVRLPRFSLQGFSGRVLQWKGFLDSFQAAVHKKHSLSPINKFNYLKANLDGQALMVISGR